jgi:hypothetical protein
MGLISTTHHSELIHPLKTFGVGDESSADSGGGVTWNSKAKSFDRVTLGLENEVTISNYPWQKRPTEHEPFTNDQYSRRVKTRERAS